MTAPKFSTHWVLHLTIGIVASIIFTSCFSASDYLARAEAENPGITDRCEPLIAMREVRRTFGPHKSPLMVTTTGPSYSLQASTFASSNSSGTGGCEDNEETEETSQIQQQKLFVAVTMDNLSEQIAQGGGPHLQSLAALLGCPVSDYPALAGMARRNFGRLFPSTETKPTTFLAYLKDQISNDPWLSVSCVYA